MLEKGGGEKAASQTVWIHSLLLCNSCLGLLLMGNDELTSREQAKQF